MSQKLRHVPSLGLNTVSKDNAACLGAMRTLTVGPIASDSIPDGLLRVVASIEKWNLRHVNQSAPCPHFPGKIAILVERLTSDPQTNTNWQSLGSWITSPRLGS